MMSLEHDLEEEEEMSELVSGGLIMFCSFCLFGAIPVASFGLAGLATDDINVMFIVSCVVSVICLFLVGAVGAKICMMNTLESGMLTMLNGIIAASTA